MAEPAAVYELPARRTPARALLVALRPRQWSKNLLVFAGIIFAAKLGDAVRWAEAWAVFAAYCAASSAAYLANDVADAEHDRRHPTKRSRPIARRELSPRTALAISGGLAAAALGVGALLGPWSLAFVAGFLALQAAYSLRLKHLVLLDVLAIAGLFVVRAAAGAEAVDVRISPWLLLCTLLLALFLALAKRRGELVLVGAEETPGRPVLEGYSLALVDQLLAVAAAATISAYSIYTFTAHSDVMVATVPFVVFGLFRYLLLVHRRDLGEEPEEVLLTDVPLVIAVAGWVAASALVVGLA